MNSFVTASGMIAAALPWRHSTTRSEDGRTLLIRDMRHNITLEIPCHNLLTADNAARHIFAHLDHYRTLIAAFYGNHRLVWS